MARLMAIVVCAQLLADFLLQPDRMAIGKRNLGVLALHAAIHAAALYLLVQYWTGWQLPAFIFLSHALIDSFKARARDTAWVFVIDQAGHLTLALLFVAIMARNTGGMHGWAGCGYAPIVVISGFVTATRGAGFLIGKLVGQLVEDNTLQLDGLKNGGRLIGQLERALIFVFVFTGNPAGIGFLVAAKSILRFEEARKQKLAEYVLIGTLLSFTMAIGIAYATQWALTLN